MALGDIISKAGSAPGVAPIKPPPAEPVQEDVVQLPSVDEIDPKDVEARRQAELREAQPKPPAAPVPPEYAGSVPETEPAFDAMGEDDYIAADDEAYVDVPPDPFSAPAPEPDLVDRPSSTPPKTEPAPEMDWANVPLPGEAAASAPTPAPAYSPDAEPPPTPEYEGSIDIDEDDGYNPSNDRGDFIKAKASGLLEKPKELYAKYPRPIIMGAIGLVVALVVVVVFGGGSPTSETPVANPGEGVVEEPIAPSVDGMEPVTLLPKRVSADCGAGQTSPALAFSNDPKEAWICPRANNIDGQVMNILFDRTVQVQSITILPGWNFVAPNGKDNWNEHRVITQILWRVGGQQFVHKINPTRSGSTFTFPGKGVAATVMSLTVQRSERPNAAGAESVDTGEGGLLPPMGPQGGPENTDVDKSLAVNSLVITGLELS